MARSTMDFAQQNTEQATDWMRAIVEQNLNQSKAAFDGLLTVARNAVRDVDQQTAAICEHSLTFAEETLSNTFDCAHKLMRMKEPQELVIHDDGLRLVRRQRVALQEHRLDAMESKKISSHQTNGTGADNHDVRAVGYR